MPLLLDSGAVYAYYDRDDDWHERVRELLDAERSTPLLPAVVLPEVDHLLARRIGSAAQEALYVDLVEHVYTVVDLAVDRLPRILELHRRFADLRIGFVDAAVAALTEQLAVRRLATTDRRHFPAIATEVRLELLP